MRSIQDIKNAFFGVVHGKNHHWWVLIVTSIGSFMTTYDLGAVSMSLPHVMNSFKVSLALTSWVLLSQLLVATALLLPAGRLGDMIGRKKIYNIGFMVFIIGSFCCGIAQNLTQLILFRIVQAAGGSMIQTNSFAIVTAVFPTRDRGKGLGFASALANIGITAGPALGGLIIGTIGWRGIFFLNVPVGIVGVVLSQLILQEKTVSMRSEKSAGSFDIMGSCLATTAIGSLLVGLSFGQDRGWSSPGTVLLLGIALTAMTVFPWFESRRSHPLVDTKLLKNRTFALNNISRFILFVAVSSNLFLMPFYLQVVLGYSPLETGMLIAPMTILIGFLAPLAGWLTNIVATRVLSATGMAILGAGLFFTSRLDLSSSYHDVLWRLLLIGLGHGIFQTPNNTSIMDSVSRDTFGIASGLMALMREIGRAMGTSLASIIVVTSMYATVGKISLYSLKGTGSSAMQGPFLQAFADSIAKALLAAALLCIPGVIFCLLRGKTARDKGKHH